MAYKWYYYHPGKQEWMFLRKSPKMESCYNDEKDINKIYAHNNMICDLLNMKADLPRTHKSFKLKRESVGDDQFF